VPVGPPSRDGEFQSIRYAKEQFLEQSENQHEEILLLLKPTGPVRCVITNNNKELFVIK